jgi:hypothetical protein
MPRAATQKGIEAAVDRVKVAAGDGFELDASQVGSICSDPAQEAAVFAALADGRPS